jgi:hypothetical protein
MKSKAIIGACVTLAVMITSPGAQVVSLTPTKTARARPLRAASVNAESLTTAQAGKITNPATAARRLYLAWKSRNRKAALKVASDEAVKKLFGVRWRPMKSKGCENENGSFECIYHDAKLDLDLAMVVEGGASAGYHVESISFSSEAASLPADNSLNTRNRVVALQ